MEINVRKDLREIIRNNELKHPYLMFYRYLAGVESKKYKMQLKEIVEKAKFFYIEEYKKRILSLKKEINLISFEGELIFRFVPGLGIQSVFENGIFLHHIYGFPYIPGSSLKGIAQDYAIKIEGKNINDPEFIDVFGSQNKRGNVIFFDAIPNQKEDLFTIDVMTPHYQEYYKEKGKKPPADYYNPNPIVFLTVKERTKFIFFLGTISNKEDILNNAKKWLQGALSHLGAGAKTSIGYGYFSNFKDIK